MKEDQDSIQFKIVFKWIGYSLLLLLILSLILSLLIQIPAAQNWIVSDVSARISKDLGTEVKIGHVELNFFDDLLIKDLLIRDLEQDTLLYSEYAYFNVDQPLLGLLRGKMSFESVELRQSHCYLKTDTDGTNNYDFLIEYFSKNQQVPNTLSETDSTRRNFEMLFDPMRATFYDIIFQHEDLQKGRNLALTLPEGHMRIFKVRPEDPFEFDALVLEQPDFVLEKYPPKLPAEIDLKDIELDTVSSTTVPESSLFILINDLIINGGKARVINKYKPVRRTNSNVVDYRDVSATDINLALSDFVYENDESNFTLTQADFRMPEGFVLKKFESENVHLTATEIDFSNFELQTQNSFLRDELKLTFTDLNDFKRFEDKVYLRADFSDSHIALNDILYFSEKLNYNEFFNLNGGKRIDLAGQIYGTINDLHGVGLDLQLADKGFLKGDFYLRNATKKGKEQLTLNLDNAQLELATLRQLIPNFNPPENFDKLGLLQFAGKFDGFFHDFTASGDMRTDLGNLNMDMRMNWGEGGFNNADYQGRLALQNFDLARWTGSDLYGITSFTAEVRDGHGLSIDEAFANVYAKLEDFYFKGYHYRNAVLQGELNRRFFDGQFYISDPNVTLDFNGHIDISDTLPKFDFIAGVEFLDLKALNLSERNIQVSGDINFDFTYHDLFNLDGEAICYDLRIIDDTVTHQLDSLRILSSLNKGGSKNLQVQSDIFDFHLIGDFDLQHLLATIRSLITKKHPQLAEKLALGNLISDSLMTANDFHFNGVLSDSRGIQKLFNSSLADFSQVVLNGSFANDTMHNFRYRMDLYAPFIQFANNKINAIALDLSGENGKSEWDIYAENIFLGAKELSPMSFHGSLTSDSLQFELNAQSFARIFSEIDLAGLLFLNDTLFQIDLANSSFRFLDEPWQVVPKNYVQLGEHFVKTENMVFLSNDSYIRVSSPGDNSLNVETEKIDISFLDNVLNKDKLKFRGYGYSLIHIDDVFSASPVSLDLTIDSFRINDDYFGTLSTDIILPNLESEGTVEFLVSDGAREFSAAGPVYLPIKPNVKKDLAYDLKCSLKDYPLKIGEYFIGHSISNTTGIINGDFEFYSDEGRPSITGEVYLDGSSKIDYLGATYRMEYQKVTLSSSLFDLSNSIIVDELGNKAEFTGGITHNHFRKFGMSATIASDYFQFLNTTKEDNNIYYGTGVGSGTVEFSGNFQQAGMRVRATTGPGTKLFIPIEDDYSTDGDAFITYVFDQDSSEQRPERVNLTGTNLDMQLNVTPDAEMQIIFDEFSGDIIKGTGSGNLTMTKERAGDLQMSGRYVIDQGQYLYTLLDFINKPFVIDRGGLITWSGDPLNADLNIQARYTGLKVPPRNLIAEYIEGRNTGTDAEVADISTQVDLMLLVRGILSQPQIDFDIRFPEIDPALRNYTESKMRILKDDVSELNRQVYGLLFFNSFLPSTINLNIAATTVNTLSEFITSQLSNYVAAYITEGVEEVDYISGVDFYFDYNYYRSEDFLQGQQTGVKTGSEFALAPNIRFFDDRLAFSPGASVIEGNVLQGSAFIGTDIKLDYFLTQDRRLKLSLFYKRFPSLQGSRNKLGVGFRFTRSYDTFGDIFRRDKEVTEEKQDPDDQDPRIQ